MLDLRLQAGFTNALPFAVVQDRKMDEKVVILQGTSVSGDEYPSSKRFFPNQTDKRALRVTASDVQNEMKTFRGVSRAQLTPNRKQRP